MDVITQTPQPQKMNYIAAYGLPKSQSFVETLLGRSLRETEVEAPLDNFELRIVDRDKLPLSVQENTPPGFRLYGLVKGTPANKVGIRLLQLTDDEYELVRMVDFGNTVFRSEGAYTFFNDRNYYRVHVLRDEIKSTPAQVSEKGEYKIYLNGDEEAAIKVAEDIRRSWLAARSPEGQQQPMEQLVPSPHGIEK